VPHFSASAVQFPREKVLYQVSSTLKFLADPPQCGASYSNSLRCPSVCLSVSHTQISPKLSEIDVWLLGNQNRNPRIPYQNLPSEVRFCRFGCFQVAFSYRLYRKDGTTLGTVAGQLSSRPITDDTLFVCDTVVLTVVGYWECDVDSVERVTHDTNLYCVNFPTGTHMHVPPGRHVSVTACIEGKVVSCTTYRLVFNKMLCRLDVFHFYNSNTLVVL